MQHRQQNINGFFSLALLSLGSFLRNVFSTPKKYKFALVFYLFFCFCCFRCVVFVFFPSRCWDFFLVCLFVCERVLLQSFSRFFLSIRDFLFILDFIFCRFDAFFVFVIIYIFFSAAVVVIPRWPLMWRSKRRMVKIKNSLKMLKTESTHSTSQTHQKEYNTKTKKFRFYFILVFLFRLLLFRAVVPVLFLLYVCFFYCVFSLVFWRWTGKHSW